MTSPETRMYAAATAGQSLGAAGIMIGARLTGGKGACHWQAHGDTGNEVPVLGFILVVLRLLLSNNMILSPSLCST